MSRQTKLPASAAAIPAAAYVRLSTKHRRYSTGKQLARIKEDAATRGLLVAVVVEEGSR